MARARTITAALAGITTGLLLAASGTSPATAGLAAPPTAHPTTAGTAPPINYHAYTSYADWRSGTRDGVTAIPLPRTGVVLTHPAGQTDYTDPHTGTTKTWDYATWTSPSYPLNFKATELVASWNAQTPPGTWIQIELHGTYNDGQTTPWYVMGRWASGDQDIKRTSVDDQGDPYSGVYTDTFAVDSSDVANGIGLVDYQLRLTLYRTPGKYVTPRVWRLGAFASAIPDRFEVEPSPLGGAEGIELDVPQFSQNIHEGQYPEYDGGGEAWCSPTSTEMAIEYFGFHPSKKQLSWVDPSYADPSVDHAARFTYDYQYEGAGNWPFNAAYAASYLGLDTMVTQLHSLYELEQFIKAGIPVITSQSFYDSELDGAGYSTSGHLMLIRGFTENGDVIANDPASSSDEAVRNIYKRHQFETVWLRTKRHLTGGGTGSGTGGIVYLYKPFWKKWPKGLDPTNPNW